jgi:hypothetical protein
MSIKENLKKAREAIIKDATGTGVSKGVREAAIEAVTHGINSAQGKKYMALFCDTKNELALLTVAGAAEANYLPQMRAYTPADAICTPDTSAGFAARLLRPDIELEAVADEDVPEGTPEPSDIRDNELAARLRQG